MTLDIDYIVSFSLFRVKKHCRCALNLLFLNAIEDSKEVICHVLEVFP